MTGQPGGKAVASTDAFRRLELRPLYLQARDLLMQRIIAGVWTPGSYLPSEMQLADELGISIGTVRKATDDLADQGLLERQHGRGTRVVTHSSASSRFRFLRFVHPDGRPLNPFAQLLARSVQKPSDEDRAHLDLSPREQVLVLLRTRTEAGVKLVYERIALPAKSFEQLGIRVGEEIVEEFYVFYQKSCGVTIVRTIDRISVDASSHIAAEHLEVAADTPLLKVDRIAIALDGKRQEYRQSWTATLRYQTELD